MALQVMALPKTSAVVGGALAAALAAGLALSLNAATAGDLDQAPPRVVVHPRHDAYPHNPFYPYDPYYPYYYSPFNPFSAYSVYDHLSGGRHQCYLPSDPCDNNHRVGN